MSIFILTFSSFFQLNVTKSVYGPRRVYAKPLLLSPCPDIFKTFRKHVARPVQTLGDGHRFQTLVAERHVAPSTCRAVKGKCFGGIGAAWVFGSLNDFQPTIKSTHAFHAGLLACPSSILYLSFILGSVPPSSRRPA